MRAAYLRHVLNSSCRSKNVWPVANLVQRCIALLMRTKMSTLVLKTGNFPSRSMSSSVAVAVLDAALMTSSKFLFSNAIYGPMNGSNTPDRRPIIGGRDPSNSSVTPSPFALRVANSDFGPVAPMLCVSSAPVPDVLAYFRLMPSALFESIKFPSASSSTSGAR